MIVTKGKSLINFDNVREAFLTDGNTYNRDKGHYLRFLFDMEDTTTWEFDSEKDLIDAWNRLIAACDGKWTICDL